MYPLLSPVMDTSFPMTKPILHKVYFLLGGCHLAMVILFAVHFGETEAVQTGIGKTISTVGYYTGSNNIFSFFAPGLSDQPYVVYTVAFSDGKERVVDLTGNSIDFANRVNNVYGYLTMTEGREIFSACLAQSMLKDYPDAEKIRVAMVIQQIPDMESYCRGERSKWKFWFHYDFENRNVVNQRRDSIR
jgi:hypothetical protein